MNYFMQSLLGRNETREDLFRQTPRHYGLANSDKTLYYIEEDNKNLGFFAMYRRWLEYLYFADICGYTPVISAGENFSYREKKTIYNTQNAFEYYFLQPSEVTVQEIRKSSRVVMSDVMHREMVALILTGRVNDYKYTKRYLYMMSRIIRKYVEFNKHTQSYLNESLKIIDFDDNKVLGVHIRGTDFRAKFYNHPVYVTEDECFLEIDNLLEKKEYSRIFVATDDKRILEKFSCRYGNKLVFFEDVQRGNGNRSVAFSSAPRNEHKYHLGLEVIRDMYVLSRCAGLVAGISQVAICAQIYKLSRNEHYEDIKMINKGVYKTGHGFTRYI